MNLTPLEESIILTIRKIKYGSLLVKIENKAITDILPTTHLKPQDLIEENTEKLLTSLAKSDKI